MLKRDEWLSLSQKLDWDFSYVDSKDVYPTQISGGPWLEHEKWKGWEEPFKTSYREYVTQQAQKDLSVYAVKEAVGRIEDAKNLPPHWLNTLKLHAATLPLAEFAAVVSNLRAARFGRDGSWRSTALMGALDEFRHTQIPLLLMHDLVKVDGQFDWTHRFYHSNNWVAIAARHIMDEMILTANPIEFAIATNFVFETGFTNLQFVGLSSLAKDVGDHMFEKMTCSIQTDEARHAQIGPAVLKVIAEHDPAYAQQMLDKWFWRSWILFAIVTGFSMDYLTPLENRKQSFKEFMQEWVLDQYLSSLAEFGLKKPWYWETFLENLDYYHHMVYASAYTYRATVWFDFALPGPEELEWLQSKYPKSWPQFNPVWKNITKRWSQSNIGNEFAVHGTSIVGFCNLCQVVLSNGTPQKNSSVTINFKGQPYIFCSEPCRWIFEQEPERYANHKDLVKRVLAGEAPGNLIKMLTDYFGLEYNNWGKDIFGGDYPWLTHSPDLSERPPQSPMMYTSLQSSKMAPLYGFLEGDTLGLLIFAYEGDTVDDLIAKLNCAAGLRVATPARQKLLYKGSPLEHHWTVSQVGFQMLDKFEVVNDL